LPLPKDNLLADLPIDALLLLFNGDDISSLLSATNLF